jgi:hypothetical protein
MRLLLDWLIGWPERVSRYLTWLGPLLARITVGWVFLWSGWGKLNNLPQITENFIGWGIPFPHILTPLTSGIEFFGGLFLARLADTHLGRCFGRDHDCRDQGREMGPGRFSGDPAGVRRIRVPGAVPLAGRRGTGAGLARRSHQPMARTSAGDCRKTNSRRKKIARAREVLPLRAWM